MTGSTPSKLQSIISEPSLKRYRTPQPTTVDTVPQVPEDALAPLYHIWNLWNGVDRFRLGLPSSTIQLTMCWKHSKDILNNLSNSMGSRSRPSLRPMSGGASCHLQVSLLRSFLSMNMERTGMTCFPWLFGIYREMSVCSTKGLLYKEWTTK